MTDKSAADLVEARGRLTMAKAFAQMLGHAYDALLHHGVNYKALPEYSDTEALDEAAKLPFKRGMEVFIGWMGRIESAIAAAVRRKGFKLVTSKNHLDPTP